MNHALVYYLFMRTSFISSNLLSMAVTEQPNGITKNVRRVAAMLALRLSGNWFSLCRRGW